MGRRGELSVALLGTLAITVLGLASSAALLQSGVGTDGSMAALLGGGMVLVLVLLLLGKTLANERILGRVEGAQAENSKRDDTQDRELLEVRAELRTLPEKIRLAKHDAVNAVTPKMGDIEDRLREAEQKLVALDRRGTP